MARTRYVKPGFFSNEGLAEFGPWHRLLFEGLWTLADRAGRLEDRPKRIAAALFPYDAERGINGTSVDGMLAELASGADPFIARYEVGGKAYIAVLTFHAHQRPHHKEPESVIPPKPRKSHQSSDTSKMGEKTQSPDQVEPSPDLSSCDPSGMGNGEWGTLERGTENGELESGLSPAAPAPEPPAWRTEPRPQPIEQSRRSHAACYHSPLACKRGVCIPMFLGQRWEHQAADGELPGRDYVAQFIELTLKFTPTGPLGDSLKFWDARWDEKHRKPTPQTKSARTMAAGDRLQAALDSGAVLDPFGLEAIRAKKQLAAGGKS